MAGFLRSRLTCFYCGRVSSQKKTPGLECFRCERCDAENYLDKNGEITDPPVHASSNARYASPLERPAAPLFDTAPSDIFCNICIQNQRVYAQSLAEYYPTPNLATFEQYEQAEAEYRASLERRYPLVCSECEPMARKRLKETSYATKADNVRHIMERTRPELMHLKIPAPWKLWILYLGGLSWTLSWAGQIAWDMVSIFMIEPTIFQLDPYYKELFLKVVERFGFGDEITSDLDGKLCLLAKYAILFGMISAWWNPRLKEKLWKKNSRMLGKSDYYTQQLIFLCVRGSALYGISLLGVAATQQQAAHLFMIIFSMMAITRSLRTLKMDYTPRANWHESPKSLLAQPPLPTEQVTPTARRRRPSRETPLFPIESLASKPLEPLPQSSSSASPPDYSAPSFQLDMPNSNDMDWSPTLASPSPYQRQLPTPLKPDPSPSGSIFSNLSPTKPTIPPSNNHPSSSLNTLLSDPTFFPPTLDKETGLESLFTSTFSISQPPPEVRDAASQLSTQKQTHLTISSLRRTIAIRLATLALLGCAYAILLWGGGASEPSTQLKLPFVAADWGGSTFVLGAAAVTTLHTLITTTLAAPPPPLAPAGSSAVSILTAIETLATAVFAGVVYDRIALPAAYFAGDREAGVVAAGQLVVGVVGVVEGVLVGRDCVRVGLLREG